MAEGGYEFSANGRPKVQQLCRYFMHGACDKGNNCRFLHDRTGTAPLNNVCKFYQKGNCSYGKRCRYEHVRVNKSANSENIPQCNHNKEREEQERRKDSRPNINHNEDNWESSMVTLSKGKPAKSAPNKNQSSTKNKTYNRKNWAKAKDFVPGEKFHAGATYAKATHRPSEEKNEDEAATAPNLTDKDLLCPYYAHGHCPYEDKCNYLHGDLCDICQLPKLHPTDSNQREHHRKECLKEIEKDMEQSFAIQGSKNKECCICLEIVLEKVDKNSSGKEATKNQFGILENCTHCFCLDCIRRWRSDKSFGKNVRVCPICRVHSDFVTPSNVWVEEEDAKKKVIQDYKDALRTKPCQYFKQGKGECPFNEKCFYKHAYPDGTIASPKPRSKPRRQMNADGELSFRESISLWDFLERREDGLISLEDELSLYLLGLLQDSDDDDDLYWLNFHPSDDSDTSSDEFFF